MSISVDPLKVFNETYLPTYILAYSYIYFIMPIWKRNEVFIYMLSHILYMYLQCYK